MMSHIRERMRQSWKKTGPELHALCSGRLRSLLADPFPVFVFHSVEPQRFEGQLLFLLNNGFSTITGDGLLENLREKTEESKKKSSELLTIQLGVFGLLRIPFSKNTTFERFSLLLPVWYLETQCYPNLEDVWEGHANTSDILQREST